MGVEGGGGGGGGRETQALQIGLKARQYVGQGVCGDKGVEQDSMAK